MSPDLSPHLTLEQTKWVRNNSMTGFLRMGDIIANYYRPLCPTEK